MKNRKFWISLIALILAALMLFGLIVGLFPTRSSAAVLAACNTCAPVSAAEGLL